MVMAGNAFKKILALLIAAVIVLGGAITAFADEDSESGNVMLEESPSGEIGAEDISGTTLDYSELEHQITNAVGLNEHDYTKESWNAMREALNSGIKLLDKAKTQQEITDAAKKLESAIAGLVKMDYSQLEKVLGVLYGKIDENEEIHSVLARIDDAISRAKSLLISGDQQAVDEAVAELNALIEELDGVRIGEPETIIKEVEVQVPPSDDFCNIAGHKIWPVLFFISLALNVALIVMIVYVFSKMKNSKDDIPLVSYDIDDDIDDMDDFEDYGEEFADEYEEEFSEEENEDD